MSKQQSRFLTGVQVRGLDKLGDVYFPGDGRFPSFSTCGCVEHVDIALEGLPKDDRKSLKMLLSVVGIAPALLARLLVRLAEGGANWPDPLGAGMRFLRLGLRGVVNSLYYSGETGRGYEGPSPLELLGYNVSVYTADVDERERQAGENGPCAAGSVAACRGLGSGSMLGDR